MEIKRTIRVILADDHPVVRRGIRRILEKAPNIQVVGEAGTGMDALRLVQESKADVILLDQEMPDLKGIQVARELRNNHLRVSIVMLSACDDDHFIEETLQAGVDGYLTKSESPSKICEMIYYAFKKYAAAIAVFLIFLLPNWAGN